VGFPRTGLLTSTSPLAATSASRAAADSLASSLRCSSAQPSSVRDEPNVARCIVALARANSAATVRYPLLHALPGRHALDEAVCARGARSSTVPAVRDIAVKNLRIVASSVLLLNFNEVRSLHFCSTGVTV
jgi:hypothetical protein